jgi:hypothetical protein
VAIGAFARDLGLFADQMKTGFGESLRAQALKVVQETQRQFPPAPAMPKFYINGTASPTLVPVNDNTQEVLIYFDHRREVATKVIAQIRAGSPKISGEYIDELTLFVDGNEARSVLEILPGRFVSVVNTAPYARRLEIGKKFDGTPFVKQVAPGIVQRNGSTLIGRDFRKVAQVIFTYQDIGRPYILKGRQIGTRYLSNVGTFVTRKGNKDRRAGDAVRYPATIILERI